MFPLGQDQPLVVAPRRSRTRDMLKDQRVVWVTSLVILVKVNGQGQASCLQCPNSQPCTIQSTLGNWACRITCLWTMLGHTSRLSYSSSLKGRIFVFRSRTSIGW